MEFLLTQEDARSYSLAISEIELADEDNGPDRLTLWLTDAEAINLFEAVDAEIGEHVREMRAAKAAFDRQRWVDPPDGDGYDPEDPKSSGWHDRMSSLWDERPWK